MSVDYDGEVESGGRKWTPQLGQGRFQIIYNLPNIMLDLGMNISYKTAIVYPTDSPLKTLFVFFDSRCFNSSINLKVFSEFNKGYDWLLE
jgi:hypothetical protein